MRKFILSIMAALFIHDASAWAADTPLPVAVPVTPPGVQAAPAPAFPSIVAPVSRPVEAPYPIVADLNDGNKVQIDPDGSVWVLQANGSKDIAPDGTLTLKDGTPFVVRNSKVVTD